MTNKLTATDVREYVAYVVDDALNGRSAGPDDIRPTDRLVGWQCGFEPLVVIVRSYLPDTHIDDEEAVELAGDYLTEINWFTDGPTNPTFVI